MMTLGNLHIPLINQVYFFHPTPNSYSVWLTLRCLEQTHNVQLQLQSVLKFSNCWWYGQSHKTAQFLHCKCKALILVKSCNFVYTIRQTSVAKKTDFLQWSQKFGINYKCYINQSLIYCSTVHHQMKKNNSLVNVIE